MRFFKFCRLILALTLVVSASLPAFAQEDKRRLSEEEIQNLFRQSAEKYQKTGTVNSGVVNTDSVEEPVQAMEEEQTLFEEENAAELAPVKGPDVMIVPENSPAVSSEYDRPIEAYVRLSDINMVVDVSGKTIREVIDMVVADAAGRTGPWKVKWRLRKEHEFLLREKVNLTAESTFGQFIDHLVDRVNNMTGVRLFVTIFDASRIIIISDTYY